AAGVVLLAVLACGLALPAQARLRADDPDEITLRAYEQEVLARVQASHARGARPMAVPDIFGQGSVLTVGNFFMKVTNCRLVGNPFTTGPSDPSGQWPGASSVESLNFAGFGVGAVNPFASDPNAVRRVSYITEWRPPTLAPEDRIYRAYDGIVNGVR